MDITRIQSSFFPSREITDPDFFVGRIEEIKEGLKALSDPGSFFTIFGLRGVGKSSVAHQIKLIAEGDVRLINILRMQMYLPKKGHDFITVFVSCDKFTKTIPDLIKRIIFGDNDNQSLFNHTKTGNNKLEEIKKTFQGGGGGKLLGLELGAEYSVEKTYQRHFSDDVIQQFKILLGIIKKDNLKKSGLLIMIDEFDVLEDKTGFASLIKTCSDDFVKFGISGIANDITELIEDHSSIGRQLHTIEIERMPEPDLYGIIRKAEHNLGGKISFDEPSKYQIINHAEGFPYFVHLLGKECLFEAFDRSQQSITMGTVKVIRDKICTGRLNTIYEEIYHSAVKSSPQRELLLKLFAEEDSNEMFSEPIYSSAKDLGVTNPSQLMRELTTPSDGSLGVLTKIREKYFRFTDPVFKVYARIRNWKFE